MTATTEYYMREISKHLCVIADEIRELREEVVEFNRREENKTE